MFVWTCRSTSVHVVWECGVASPVQGDGKPVKRAHPSRFWSLKFMFWGIGALMSPTLVSSLQSRCPSDPFKEDTSLNNYRHCYSRISHHGGAGVHLCLRSSCPVSCLYCALYFQSAAQSFLCPFILFFHIIHEKLDYIVQEIRELTPRMFYPHAVPHMAASSKWPRTSETALRNMENKVLRTQFELTELRISAYLVMEITMNDAAPKRPMQMETGGAGCAGSETPSKLLPGEDSKSRFHKDAAFFHFKVPLKRVRRRSGPRGISDQTPVDIKERMGCVFTHWCLF